MYGITARGMISGRVLKWRTGLGLVIFRCQATAHSRSRWFALTGPLAVFG